MSQTFYIADNGTQKGPFTYDEMRDQHLTKDTMVWTEGLINWTKAGSVAILRDLISASPPPISGFEQKYSSPPPAPPVSGSKVYFGYQLASRTDRFIAALLESVVILVPLMLIFGWEVYDDLYDVSAIGTHIFFSALYGAILYPAFSGNLGHRLMGLKVISAGDGSDQKAPVKGAIREVLKSVFGLIFISYIWLLWDDKNQNLYDKAARTLVVKK